MSRKDEDAPGRLAENLLLFCRMLRRAGVPVGSGQVIDALVAVRATGLARRDDLYAALRAVLIKDPAHFRLFQQAFHLYFRNPRLRERMLALMLPRIDAERNARRAGGTVRRLLEALAAPAAERGGATEADVDRSLSASRREMLAQKDFEQMTVAELGEAKELLRAELRPLKDVQTRRFRASSHGHRYDLRRSMRLMLRNNGQLVLLARKRRLTRPPVLVLICDISGSMSRYSRIFLHFAHALTGQHRKVVSFVFATRLTNISHRLAEKDVDRALSRISADVADWDGGTRIGDCLERFNNDWGRRVLAQNAVVLLLTDGLERDSEASLEFQMQRLALTCRQLIWLNPVLRYADFEPKASGIRRMLPHVDLFLPAHNVDSLRALAAILSSPAASGPARPAARQYGTAA